MARPDFNVDLDELPVERTLGILWNAERDQFFFQLNAPKEASAKRQVLAAVSSIFDPLGLITCVTITMKVFLQDTWRVGKDPFPDGKKARKLAWDCEATSMLNARPLTDLSVDPQDKPTYPKPLSFGATTPAHPTG